MPSCVEHEKSFITSGQGVWQLNAEYSFLHHTVFEAKMRRVFNPPTRIPSYMELHVPVGIPLVMLGSISCFMYVKGNGT